MSKKQVVQLWIITSVVTGIILGMLDAWYVVVGNFGLLRDYFFISALAVFVSLWVVIAGIVWGIFYFVVGNLVQYKKPTIVLPLPNAFLLTLFRINLIVYIAILLFVTVRFLHAQKPYPESLTFAKQQSTTADSNEPNIILITIDTLRADRLGIYGYTQIQTPNIDTFADQSFVFNNAYTQSNWTFPSLASLMSAKYPSELDISINKKPLPQVQKEDVLKDSEKTLAEYLRQNGWYTQAIVTNPFLTQAKGFAQGFEGFFNVTEETKVYHFRERGKKAAVFRMVKKLGRSFSDLLESTYKEVTNEIDDPFEIDADKVTDFTISWLEASADKGRFFLWTHYMDVHAPYDPPRDFFPEFENVSYNSARYIGREGTVDKKNVRFGPKEIEISSRLYDAEIEHLDHELGRLFQYFEDTQLLDNSIIIVASDHGEEFWEHGNPGHGLAFYNESIRVPLIIRLPKTQGRHIGQAVGLIHLTPSILNYVGISDLPNSNYQLVNLFDAQDDYPLVISEGNVLTTDKKAIIDGNWKAILDMNTQGLELYNLLSDPHEQFDQAQINPIKAAQLREQLVTFITEIEVQDKKRDVHYETSEELEFGY